MTGSRIATLDALRGVAVMGILTMNIIGFAMIDAAYFNPHAQGAASGADMAVYLTNFILFDGKMRGLFSFLFGASLLLITDRAQASGASPARTHFSRTFWLLIFGLTHLYLVWWGDILAHYAIIGMVAYALRGLSTPALVKWGIGLVAAHFLLMLGLPLGVAAAQAQLADPAHAADARTALDGFARQFGTPSPAQAAQQIALYGQGSYGAILTDRIDRFLWAPLSALAFLGLETLGYMAFGMAAYRSGLLTGAWKRSRYLRWATIGFALTLPAYAALAAWLASRDFDLFSVTMGVVALTVPIRPLMILAFACLIVLLLRPGGTLTERIGAAGRMAFTNYLLTSLICTALFYGYGAGLFGQLSRAALYLVVLAIWAGMLLWSKPWLDRFAYGPFEWLWRSLARGAVQPMRRTDHANASH